MPFTTKDTGRVSTSTNRGQSSSACTGCPKVVQPDSGIPSLTAVDGGALLEKLLSYAQEQNNLTARILELEKEQDKSVAFYRSATKLNKVARTTMWLLLLVPKEKDECAEALRTIYEPLFCLLTDAVLLDLNGAAEMDSYLQEYVNAVTAFFDKYAEVIEEQLLCKKH